MGLSIASLNSGSNGNCYYIGNEEEAILVDAGISCRETDRRMKRLGLSIEKVKAIFISHEHSDHIRGIPSIAKKHRLPVYITANTLKNGYLHLDRSLVHSFDFYTPVAIGNLHITAFPKIHDAADPCSFIIEQDKIRIGVFTDIGRTCENVIRHFSTCNAAFLEANYDVKMLDQGRYPFFLKNRIRGGQGHLSNEEALALFRKHKPAFMSHLLLSHLSQDNNCPNLVQELFNAHAGETTIVVASRHQETAVYKITASQEPVAIPAKRLVSYSQLQLAFN